MAERLSRPDADSTHRTRGTEPPKESKSIVIQQIEGGWVVGWVGGREGGRVDGWVVGWVGRLVSRQLCVISGQRDVVNNDSIRLEGFWSA